MDNTLLFVQLKKILDEFDRVCNENNLHYTLFAGSLLGAVRHRGFIPWDDDLDVAMPRKDYDKLLALGNKPFSAPFFLQTPFSDAGYHKGFAKLRNSNTTEIPYKDAAFDYNHGLFIDIFPLDTIPNNVKLFNKQIQQLKNIARLQHFTGRYSGKVGSLRLTGLTKIAYYCLLPLCKLKIITSEKVFKNYNKIASEYEDSDGAFIGTICFSFDGKRFIYDKNDYSDTVLVEFEGDMYPAPVGYDSVLKKSYGDYMTPVKQKSEHGDTIIDIETPYLEYIHNHKQELVELFENNI